MDFSFPDASTGIMSSTQGLPPGSRFLSSPTNSPNLKLEDHGMSYSNFSFHVRTLSSIDGNHTNLANCMSTSPRDFFLKKLEMSQTLSPQEKNLAEDVQENNNINPTHMQSNALNQHPTTNSPSEENHQISVDVPSENFRISLAENKAKTKIKKNLIVVSVNLLANIFGLLSETLIIPYASFLYLLACLSIILIFQRILKGKSEIYYLKEKMVLFYETLNLMGFPIYFVLALLKGYEIIASSHLTIISCCCAGLSFLALTAKILAPTSPFSKRENFIQLLVWCQLILISFKVEGTNIPWTLTLILCYGCIFMVLLMLLVLLTTGIFGVLFKFHSLNIAAAVEGAWRFLILSSSAFWIVLLIFIQKKIDSKYNPTALKSIFIAGICYSIFLFGVAFIFKKKLVKYLAIEIMQSAEEPPVAIQEEKFRFEKVGTSVLYLVKLSATYFASGFDKLYAKEQQILQRWTKHSKHAKKGSASEKVAELTIKPIKRASLPINDFSNSPNPPAEYLNIKEKKERIRYSYDDIELYKIRKHIVGYEEKEKQEKERCVICLEKEPDAVIMECAHGGICFDCSLKTWQKSNQCYMCRSKISVILKVKNYSDLHITRPIEATVKLN